VSEVPRSSVTALKDMHITIADHLVHLFEVLDRDSEICRRVEGIVHLKIKMLYDLLSSVENKKRHNAHNCSFSG